MMDDPNITMEEYIRLEEEKAQKYGKVFNWETATYDKIWNDEDIHDHRSVETEFPAIAFNDDVSSKALSCEPTVSSLNNEIDFRILFDDSDDEDYTPAISCFDDLDFFKDFENEFPAIVYNDALTSKSDLLTEPILNPQHVDEFDLNNETSLFEYDEEEQNVLYFNDLFPFNVIHHNYLKSNKDNDDNEIAIIQFLEGKLVSKDGYGVLDMAPLPPCEQRHPFLRYQGLEYSDADIADFKESRAWGRLFDTRGLLVWELILEFLSTLRFGEVLLDLDDPGTRVRMRGCSLGMGDLHDYWRGISTDGDILGPPPSYTLIRDPMLRLCHQMKAHSIAGRSQAPKKVTVTDLFYLRGLDVGSVNITYLLARYLRRLLTAKILGGLMVIAPELLIIDMVAEDAPAVDEGDQAIPAPMQAPQQPPPPPPAAARTMPSEIKETRGGGTRTV
ncbi:hypothetical protein Tco_0568026 [Tanacetum coccineum]